MKKRTIAGLAVCGLLVCVLTAAQISDNTFFSGIVDFTTGCIWKIAGTQVTTTAAELNTLHGASQYVTNSGALTVTGNLIATNLYLNGNGTVTGNAAVTGTESVGSTLTAGGAVTLGSTLTVTGAVTMVAAPALKAAKGTPGTVTCVLTNAPTSTTTVAVWVNVSDGSASYWIPAFHQ